MARVFAIGKGEAEAVRQSDGAHSPSGGGVHVCCCESEGYEQVLQS